MKDLFSISSIFSLIFRHLGRENNPTSQEISTYMRNIGGLGREMRPAEVGISTFFGIFSLFG